MTAPLRIADIADQADVSTATIRYYERIGVLPTPARAANGYRIYDERTVERLGFVSRAKQLGCSLDEITELATAWEGGHCGPVQDGLQELVAEKLVATGQEIERLATLSAELQTAAKTLGQHRPDGPCDAQCGCVGAIEPAAPAPESQPTPIALMSKPAIPEALASCSLDRERLPTRIEEWQALLATGLERTAIPGGVRVEFGDVDVAALAELVAAERDCCSFFSAITVDARGIGLETTAPADALDAVYAVLGTPAQFVTQMDASSDGR